MSFYRMAKESSHVAVDRTSLSKITLKKGIKTMIKFTKGSQIDLTLQIKGNAVDISFTFLGTKTVVGGVDFFNFISNTATPFKQRMSLASIEACLPAPAVEASFELPSLTQELDSDA